jgi:hypothetical protein
MIKPDYYGFNQEYKNIMKIFSSENNKSFKFKILPLRTLSQS